MANDWDGGFVHASWFGPRWKSAEEIPTAAATAFLAFDDPHGFYSFVIPSSLGQTNNLYLAINSQLLKGPIFIIGVQWRCDPFLCQSKEVVTPQNYSQPRE